MSESLFPLMALSRHRLMTDGQGVTTLAAAWFCPLRCRMCLNPQCFSPAGEVRYVSPEELYDMARADDLYFRATNGGVTFGGGEPLTHADFIRDFRKLSAGWRLAAETSLNVAEEKLSLVLDSLDEFIVDIKDMDPDIYLSYTGKSNALVKSNLRLLGASVAPEKVLIRLPRIPGFNDNKDNERSLKELKDMGFSRFDRFTYIERKRASERDKTSVP